MVDKISIDLHHVVWLKEQGFKVVELLVILTNHGKDVLELRDRRKDFLKRWKLKVHGKGSQGNG